MPLTIWVVYFGLGAIATVFELARPSRKLNYWALDAIALDIVSFFFTQFVVFYWADYIRGHIPLHFKPVQLLIAIPLPVRVVAYVLVADLGGYWMHRLTHTKYLWRVHHFHHSITQMYWLAGVRDTIFQQTLSNLHYILWAPLVFDAPREVFTGLVIMNILTNHWMHMNFSWRSNWLEYVFVTPRSHAIHHSASPEHYNTNFGVIFSIWDRIFLTWKDPDTTTVTDVGAGTIANPWQAAWLMLGVFSAEPDAMVRSRVDRVLPFANGSWWRRSDVTARGSPASAAARRPKPNARKRKRKR